MRAMRVACDMHGIRRARFGPRLCRMRLCSYWCLHTRSPRIMHGKANVTVLPLTLSKTWKSIALADSKRSAGRKT